MSIYSPQNAKKRSSDGVVERRTDLELVVVQSEATDGAVVVYSLHGGDGFREKGWVAKG